MTTTRHRVPWIVPLTHPAFDGHFPGNPILPGVVLMSEVIETARAHAGLPWSRVDAGQWHIASTKFLAPLSPGDACHIELQVDATSDGSAKLRFDIKRGDTVAATGSMSVQATSDATS